MTEVHQLASAVLTIIFATLMVAFGHLYIEHRSTRTPTLPIAQAFIP